VIAAQILPAWYNDVLDDPESVEGQWYEWMTRKSTVEIVQVISVIFSGIGAAFIWVA